MFREATILLYKEESPVDVYLARLTEFWGVPCRMLRIGEADNPVAIFSPRHSLPCVMVSARTLAAILHDEVAPREVVADLLERTPFVFIYGITPDGPETHA